MPAVKSNQLPAFKEQAKDELARTETGVPIGDRTNTTSFGPRGPLVFQDVQFLDELGHLSRERTPERVVHAKGGAAFGYNFDVTNDIQRALPRIALFLGGEAHLRRRPLLHCRRRERLHGHRP